MVSIGRKALRSYLMGSGIGLISSLATYVSVKALNILAGQNVLSEIGLALFTYGMITLIFVGVSLSEDLEEKK